MTDLEITKLCAEAMGWKHLGAVGVVDDALKYAREYDKKYPGKLWCLSGGNDWWEDPQGHSVCGVCSMIPNPLEDDAKAMALVKKLRLSIYESDEIDGGWDVWGGDTGDRICGDGLDLNRAICECVAKMQSAK